jgi:hypothetical protein
MQSWHWGRPTHEVCLRQTSTSVNSLFRSKMLFPCKKYGAPPCSLWKKNPLPPNFLSSNCASPAPYKWFTPGQLTKIPTSQFAQEEEPLDFARQGRWFSSGNGLRWYQNVWPWCNEYLFVLHFTKNVRSRWDSILTNYDGKLIWRDIMESSHITHPLMWTPHLQKPCAQQGSQLLDRNSVWLA